MFFKLKVFQKIHKDFRGETLAETLIALLIGVLALLMLPMAIVTSARINQKVRDISTVEDKINSESISSGVVTLKEKKAGAETETETVSSVTIFRDPSGYVFYRYGE